MTTTTIPDPSQIHTLALRAIPGWATSKERLDRLATFEGTRGRELTREIEAAHGQLRAALVDHADGKETDPRSISASIFALKAELDVELLVQSTATVVHSLLQNETRALDNTQKDHALAWLNDILGALIAEVRYLDSALDAVGSQSAALRGTDAQTAAWKRLDALVDVYDAIRNTQRTILTTDEGGPVMLGKLHRAGLLADALDRDRFWIERRLEVARSNYHADEKYAPYLAWLSPWQTVDDVQRQTPRGTLEGTWWPDDDRHAYLRWVAVKATAWVPSTTQLESASNAALHAMELNGLPHAHEYFTITGTKPLHTLPPLPGTAEHTASKTKPLGFDHTKPRQVTFAG